MKSIQTWVRMLAVAVLLMAGGLAPTMASAQGVQKQMDRVFDSMSNVTKPTAVTTARRGVVSGGSIEVRNKVMNPQLLTLDPPSFSAGCSGISLSLGSFSYISGDQIVQMMRSVASNAAGYAFELALSNLCDQCAQWISKFEDVERKVSSASRNSCAIAQGAVNYASGNGWNTNDMSTQTQANQTSDSARVDDGSASDYADAQNNQTNGQSSADKLHEEDPEKSLKLLEANVVWKALSDQSAKDWWVDGDKDLLEEIMSLTGTTVTCHLETSGCGGDGDVPQSDTNGYVTYVVAPTLVLDDLIEGTTGQPVSVLECNDDNCFSPVKTPRTFKGMQQRVEEVMFGTDGVSGLVAKLTVDRGEKLTAEEQGFLQNAQPFSGGLVYLSEYDPGSAEYYAHQMVPVLSLQMTYSLASSMIRTARLSVAQARVGDVAMTSNLLKDAKTRLDQDRKILADRIASNTEALESRIKLVQALRADTMPSAAAGSR